MLFTLYAEGILLDGNNLKMMNTIKQLLSSIFEIKDMCDVRYVLGVKIVSNHPKRILGMCQKACIKRVLELF